MLHILFVCTGNTCRSPLAEGMLRMMAQRGQLDIEVRSAGVSAMNGGPISGNSATLLREKGFQDRIVSGAVSQDKVEWANFIFTMTVAHKRSLIGRFPDAVEKTFTLKEFVEDDPHILAALEEREQLAADLQLKQALSQSVSSEERGRLLLLEDTIPSYDISDPFGGSLAVYRQTAEEIEHSLHKLLTKLKNLYT